ncbi:unnamed protein product, partial [Gongylonema pulchrum]|uniref:PDEase domain-containing protein n=1 Tax=Gongylonema pulchrum TaxID=637853 RepID=A0A183EG59_9BILA
MLITDFFEPELMANPPLLAVQFVYELRKMIDVAKDRIRMKRHVPTLTTITENGESDEYLEIPRPPSRMHERSEEPSPKSLNSVDSGCDSMSDEDAQNQQVHEKAHDDNQHEIKDTVEHVEMGDAAGKQQNFHETQTVQQCAAVPSKIPVISSLLPRPVTATKVAPLSRIPTMASSRTMSSTVTPL